MIIIDGKMIKKFLVLLFILIFSGSINFANAQPLGTFTFPPNPSIFPGPVTFLGTVTGAGSTNPLCTTTPEANGAIGDGVTNDTTAIQAAITTAQNVTSNGGGSICLGAKTYKISSALSVTKSISIVGAGVYSFRGTGGSTNGVALNLPVVSPYIGGSILYQSGTSVDGITITGTGTTVNLRNFGIYFGTTFTNTGHGINVIPPNISGHPDQGIVDSEWANLTVFGHDGNHYAFNFTNALLDTFTNLRSYGGGGISFTNDTCCFNYGNTVFLHPYHVVLQSGSAHAFQLVQTNNVLNMLVFIRPQAWVFNAQAQGGIFASIGPPTASQKEWSGFSGQGQVLEIIQPDMETNVSSTSDLTASTTLMPTRSMISPGYKNPAVISSEADSSTTPSFKFGDLTPNYDDVFYPWGLIGANPSSTNVTAVAGANAGTSPPAPVIGTSKDLRGLITFGTGTTPAAGAQVVVTLHKTYGSVPVVQITPLNAATQALGLYIGATTANSFTVSTASAPAGSQGNTIYSFSYVVVD